MTEADSKTDAGEAIADNPQGRSIWTAWALSRWLPLMILLLLLFYGTGAHMVKTWWASASFNHGFIIPFIAGWLVYEKLPDLYRLKPDYSWLGILGMFVAGVLWFLGEIASVDLVSEAGFVGMIQASILAIFGMKALRLLLFPIAYLAFMVPIGEELVPILQVFTADFVVAGIRLFDIPVHHDGVFISIPAGNFLVAEACSGVRFLIATIAVGTVFAYIGFRSWWRKAMIILLSIVIPVIGNGIRAWLLVMIAHWSEMEYATGYDHIVYGYVFFTIILLVFLAIGWRFSDIKTIDGRQSGEEETVAPAAGQPATVKALVPVITAYVLVAGIWFSGQGINAEINKAHPEMPDFTSFIQWRRSVVDDTVWTPVFANADKEERHLFRAGSRQVSVYSAHYFNQIDGKELVQGSNLITGSQWKRAATEMVDLPEAFPLDKVQEDRINYQGRSRLVWTVYYIDGVLLYDRYDVKLKTVSSRLQGRGAPAGALLISTDILRGDEAEARDALKAFLASASDLKAYFASQIM